MIPGEHEAAGISADPDDDKYVAAAIEGRSAFVVSEDSDLLKIGEHEGVRFVTPRRTLSMCYAAGERARIGDRRRSTSRIGGSPKSRLYSRLKCDGSSYPTR